MSGIIHRVLARTVSRVAPGSVPVVFEIDGVNHSVRACRMNTEKRVSQLGAGGYQGDDVLDETLFCERRLNVPAHALPRLPDIGTPVQDAGETYFVTATLDRGPVFFIGLGLWRP